MAKEIATLGGGCFWCLEAVYDQLKGVSDVVSGYSGGHVHNPTYQQIGSKTTGHAEVIQIEFDTDVVSFGGNSRYFLHDSRPDNTESTRQ